jgi:transcriptional regulator GlxA family with amidase domain
VRWRPILLGSASVAVLSSAGFAAWLASLPPSPPVSPAPSIDAQEIQAMLAALKPPKRRRPLIATVAINDATEVTDYIVPYGILRRAGIADVTMLATSPGPVTLYPALRVQPDATISEFDANHPDGADYVIVPAMSRDDHPRIMSWLKDQFAKGATIIGVCAGAKVVAAAGLLDNRRGTTHWYYVEDMIDEHPSIQYVPNRRMVVDQRVGTTTGVTASMPMILTLIEGISGRSKAESIAADLGLEEWNARHSSDAFGLTRQLAVTTLVNRLAFWRHERFGIELQPGTDEVSIALVADAWSRTYRSRAFTFAPASSPVETRSGVRILPDLVSANVPQDQRLPTIERLHPSDALNQALRAIEDRYGRNTAHVVAMQLEYPVEQRE